MIEALFFVLAVIVCFFLLGKFFVTKLKLELDFLEDIFFSTTIGILLFTLISYLLSFVKAEVLILPVVLVAGVLVLKKKRWLPRPFDIRHRTPMFLVLVMVAIFSLNMLVKGIYGDMAIYLRDDLWHLALINELKMHFPPDNPGFAGVPLFGYHFFYNFLLATLSNIFFLSPASLHFHFFPVLVAFLWAIGVYVLMYRWSKGSISTSLWAVFLTLFGGSFAFILHMQGHTNISLDSGFGVSQATPSLANPPFAISIVIVVASLFALHRFLTTREAKWMVPIILCLGLVTMFKVYAGMILIGAFTILAFFEVTKKKFTIFKTLAVTFFVFLGTYWVFADRAAGLIFHPFWSPHSMVIDNFPWYGYIEKQYTYSQLSVIRGLIEIEVYAFSNFIFGNLGSRLIGLVALFLVFYKNRKAPSLFALTVLAMLLIAFLIPMLFLQTGKVFEIIQMNWYALFFASLFAAFGFAALFRLRLPRVIKLGLLLLIVTVTLPSAYEYYQGYVRGDIVPKKLSGPYHASMTFLASQENYDATVLEVPRDDGINYWYEKNNPAITAFGNKRAFLANQFIDFPGTDGTMRKQFLKDIVVLEETSQKDPRFVPLGRDVKDGFAKYEITFVYSPRPLSALEALGGVKVFENDEAVIYKIRN